MPQNMGSLYWQANDCWPVASWSSMDYFGRWKALMYYTKRFYAPTLVSMHADGDKMNFYVVSDSPQTKNRGDENYGTRSEWQAAFVKDDQRDCRTAAGQAIRNNFRKRPIERRR